MFTEVIMSSDFLPYVNALSGLSVFTLLVTKSSAPGP